MAVGVSRPSSDVRQGLRTAALAIERDVDVLAEEIADVLHREEPALPDDPRAREETRRGSRGAIVGFLRALQRGEPLCGSPLPAEALIAARNAARTYGSPLPLMRMCMLAHEAFADAWDRELAGADLPPAVRTRAIGESHQLGFAWIRHLANELTAEFERERRCWTRSPQAARGDAVRGILADDPLDADAVSRLLGYELRRHHLGLVLWVAPEHDEATAMAELERTAAAIAGELGAGRPLVIAASTGSAWAWIGYDGRFAASTLDRAFPSATTTGISVSVGEAAHGVQGFRDTHRDAVDAACVARLAAHPLGAIIRYSQVQLGALLVGELPRARRFVRLQLAGLAAEGDEYARLRSTLKLYLEENASRLAVARRLGIHVNTVTNRVRSGQNLMGRDLHEHQVELHVALTLAEMLGPAVLGRSDQRP